MADYDNWKSTVPTMSTTELLDLMESEGVREFDAHEKVATNDGRIGYVVGCKITDSGKRLYRVEFNIDGEIDHDSFFANELTAV